MTDKAAAKLESKIALIVTVHLSQQYVYLRNGCAKNLQSSQQEQTSIELCEMNC